MLSIVERLRAACVGHPYAKIAWPHYILHEAADHILKLEAENHQLRRKLKFTTFVAQDYGDEVTDEQLARIDALVDQKDISEMEIVSGPGWKFKPE